MAGRIVVICICFILLNSCNKDRTAHEENRTRIALSGEALKWLDVKEDTFSMRSSNGLSDFYTVGSFHSYPLTSIKGELVYGENISRGMSSSLILTDFRLSISNECGNECFEITYQQFNADGSHLVTQKFLAYPPFTTIDFHYVPLETNSQSKGLRYIGDTTINSVHYKDIFINGILHDQYNDAFAIKTIYVSKSLGLVGFITLGNIGWYRF